MFTKEYVCQILEPFTNKKLRYKRPKDFPLLLESSIENTFEIELTSTGISFVLKNDFYLNKDLDKLLNEALREQNIYAFELDSLVKENVEECTVFRKLVESMNKNIKVQIAFTYFYIIQSLDVNERSFKINGYEFIVCN